MPQSRTTRWFWAKVVALQIALLLLWWAVLYQPSLALLRIVAEVPFTLLTSRQSKPALDIDASTGEWKFSIPVTPFAHDPGNGAGRVLVNAIEFAGPPENVAPFTTGWFVYLGLALAGPINRSNLRRILIGLLAQTAVSALALFFYAEVNAIGIAANMRPSPDATVLWLTKVAYHIDYLVVPYAGPFFVALLTHPLWSSVVTAAQVTSQPAPAAVKSRSPRARAIGQ